MESLPLLVGLEHEVEEGSVAGPKVVDGIDGGLLVLSHQSCFEESPGGPLGDPLLRRRVIVRLIIAPKIVDVVILRRGRFERTLRRRHLVRVAGGGGRWWDWRWRRIRLRSSSGRSSSRSCFFRPRIEGVPPEVLLWRRW